MNRRIIISIIFSFFIFHFSLSSGYAKIPEPDNVIYGPAREDAVVTALKINGETIATYTQGENPGAGDYYILRVPIDSYDPQEPDTARPGDVGYIYINNETEPSATVTIGERGTVHMVSLSLDPDEDGLTDDVEEAIGTDPNNPDTDGDGMPDGWEHDNGLDPLHNDAFADSDGDGCMNISEYLSGTGPDNPNSKSDCHPIADAGADQNSETGMEVILDGTDSFDPEGNMITFNWTFTETPPYSAVTLDSLSDPLSAKPNFAADVDGDYVLQLIINNGVLDSFADEVVITASVPNVAPNADAGHDRNALTGTAVDLSGVGSNDPDSGPQLLSYSWSFEALPLTSMLTDTDIADGNTASAGFVPDVDGSYEVMLSVNDGELSDYDIVQVVAGSSNVLPNADAGDDAEFILGAAAVCDGSESNDPDNGPQPLVYNWNFVAVPAGSSITDGDLADAGTVTPSFTPDVTGTYVLELAVSDGEGLDYDNAAVTVLADTDNDTVPDDIDNCLQTANTNQDDTDGDGYGNMCDCDLDNDGFVGPNDYTLFGSAWWSNPQSPNWNADADFDSDGFVGPNDYTIFGSRWWTNGPWD